MSPRRPAALRGTGTDATIAEHLVEVAARLIAEHGTSGLTVHAIAKAAGVADGALYNHFANKEELLARALGAHVGAVFAAHGAVPEPGDGTVEDNLRQLVTMGLAVLGRILPAFAGVMGNAQLINGLGDHLAEHGPAGLPSMLSDYLEAEQRLGRVAAEADCRAAATLIIGACHEVALPGLFRGLPVPELEVPPGFVDGLVGVVLRGIAPR